jgi:hypothetical protein
MKWIKLSLKKPVPWWRFRQKRKIAEWLASVEEVIAPHEDAMLKVMEEAVIDQLCFGRPLKITQEKIDALTEKIVASKKKV